MTNRRKVGMTSSHHGPYGQGYTRTTMQWTKGSKPATVSKSHKPRLSSDRRLQLACVKVESLVIPDQHCWSEYVSGSCTHRPGTNSLQYADLQLLAIPPSRRRVAACDLN